MISDLVDRNCDGKVRIVFIGDSIVYGFGDERNKGGYVGRLDQKLRNKYLRIKKFAVSGITTQLLLKQIKSKMSKRKKNLYNILIEADAVIVDVGRNDYWDRKTPEYTANTIKRIMNYIRNYKDYSIPPYVTASTLIHVKKTKIQQYNFVLQLNKRIYNRKDIGCVINQHEFPQSILSADGLHPNAKGYTYIYRQLLKQLKNELVNAMLEN